jgi:putative DNA primase/helicase
MRDRASKALENACRIAGVLAVIEGGLSTRSITRKHLESGLELIQWYLAEALRIRGAVIVPQAVIDAESLSKWLSDRNIEAFRSAPLLTKGPSQLRNKPRLKAAIHELVFNGYLAENPSGTTIEGVKARESWRVLHHVV